MEMKLIIFAGPSGTGKTTIVKHLLQQIPSLSFSVSCTTRSQREGEIEGKDYYFLSEEAFRQKIAENQFVEYEEVYAGTLYGTLKEEIERIWANQQHVIFDIDVIGALNIKKMYADKALAVVVQPPSIAVLKERLSGRGSETPEKVAMRIAKAEKELSYAPQFDQQLVNDQLDDSLAAAYTLVNNFIK